MLELSMQSLKYSATVQIGIYNFAITTKVVAIFSCENKCATFYQMTSSPSDDHLMIVLLFPFINFALLISFRNLGYVIFIKL